MPDIGHLILSGLMGGAHSYDQALTHALALGELSRRLRERSGAQQAMTGMYDLAYPAPPRSIDVPVPGAPRPMVPNPQAGTAADPGYFTQQIAGGIESAAGEGGLPTDSGSPLGAALAQLRGVSPQALPPTMPGPRPTQSQPNPAYGNWEQTRGGFSQAGPELQAHLLPMVQHAAQKRRLTEEWNQFASKVEDFRQRAHEAGFGDQADQDAGKALQDGVWPASWHLPGHTPRKVIPPHVLDELEAMHAAGVNNWHAQMGLMGGGAGGDWGHLVAAAQQGDPAAQGTLLQMGIHPNAWQPQVKAAAAGHVTPEMLSGMQSEDPAARAQAATDYQNAIGKPPPSHLLRKAGPTFTTEMVRAAYPTLKDEGLQGVVDASNQAGKLIRPIGIALRPNEKPTRDEAETRASEIMATAGIEDPENHPAFGLLAYKIEHGKDIDQKTADRMFGSSDTSRRVVLTAVGAMAKDAATRMAIADRAANTWRAKNAKKPVPAELAEEQRAARKFYEDAHDRWEQALSEAAPSGSAAGQRRQRGPSLMSPGEQGYDAKAANEGWVNTRDAQGRPWLMGRQEAERLGLLDQDHQGTAPAPAPAARAKPAARGPAAPAAAPAPSGDTAAAAMEAAMDRLGIPRGRPLTPEEKQRIRAELGAATGAKP